MEVASRHHRSARPRPGWAEQDPAAWLSAMAACWAGAQGASWAGLAPVDRRLLAGEHARLRRRGAAARQPGHHLAGHPRRAGGCGARCSRGSTGATSSGAVRSRSTPRSRCRAWRGWPATQPQARGRARWLLSPKDYCVAALTGEVVTDAISPVGLVGPDGGYSPASRPRAGRGRARMPPLRPFDALGRARGVRANAVGLPPGVPVAVGTMDAWGSVFGSGLVRPGTGDGGGRHVGDRGRRSPTGRCRRPASSPSRPYAGGTSTPGRRRRAATRWSGRRECFGRSVEDVLALADGGAARPTAARLPAAPRGRACPPLEPRRARRASSG